MSTGVLLELPERLQILDQIDGHAMAKRADDLDFCGPRDPHRQRSLRGVRHDGDLFAAGPAGQAVVMPSLDACRRSSREGLHHIHLHKDLDLIRRQSPPHPKEPVWKIAAWAGRSGCADTYPSRRPLIRAAPTIVTF